MQQYKFTHNSILERATNEQNYQLYLQEPTRECCNDKSPFINRINKLLFTAGGMQQIT